MEVKLASIGNATTKTAAATAQLALSRKISNCGKDVRGLARKRAEPAEAPSWSGSQPSPGEQRVTIFGEALPGGVLADLTPLVLVRT